jgi:hypothetical protein
LCPRNSKDPLRVVLVRDMWLTGFDAPCMNTMYVDKPMRRHGLMQAIAGGRNLVPRTLTLWNRNELSLTPAGCPSLSFT